MAKNDSTDDAPKTALNREDGTPDSPTGALTVDADATVTGDEAAAIAAQKADPDAEDVAPPTVVEGASWASHGACSVCTTTAFPYRLHMPCPSNPDHGDLNPVLSVPKTNGEGGKEFHDIDGNVVELGTEPVRASIDTGTHGDDTADDQKD